MVDVKFALSIFYSHTFVKGLTTCITWRGVLSLFNNTERMPVIFIYVSFFIPNARILPNNTSRMSSKLTFFTVIEPIVWMSFFFTI
jgi:hypothetical protein